MLGIYPDLDDVLAYLSKDLREWSKEIVNAINECGNFEKEVKKNHASHGYTTYDSILFKDKEGGIAIARVDVSEEDFYTCYRDKDGNIETITSFKDGYTEDTIERDKGKLFQFLSL